MTAQALQMGDEGHNRNRAGTSLPVRALAPDLARSIGEGQGGLRAGDAGEVARLIVTASGGPFRGWSAAELAGVTVEQALAHPTWNMGPVVTINSATLVNKGLELLEAHLLFDVPLDRVQVVVQAAGNVRDRALGSGPRPVGDQAWEMAVVAAHRDGAADLRADRGFTLGGELTGDARTGAKLLRLHGRNALLADLDRRWPARLPARFVLAAAAGQDCCRQHSCRAQRLSPGEAADDIVEISERIFVLFHPHPLNDFFQYELTLGLSGSPQGTNPLTTKKRTLWAVRSEPLLAFACQLP